MDRPLYTTGEGPRPRPHPAWQLAVGWLMHNCITLCRASVVLEYSRLLMTSWVLLPEHICERWLGTDSAFAFDGLNRSTIPGRKPFSVSFLRSLDGFFSLCVASFVVVHTSCATKRPFGTRKPSSSFSSTAICVSVVSFSCRSLLLWASVVSFSCRSL